MTMVLIGARGAVAARCPLRQLPVELVKALPESDGTVQGQVWSWISKTLACSVGIIPFSNSPDNCYC